MIRLYIHRDDGCPASFVTRITNPVGAKAQLSSPASHIAVAQSLAARLLCHHRHVLQQQEQQHNFQPRDRELGQHRATRQP